MSLIKAGIIGLTVATIALLFTGVNGAKLDGRPGHGPEKPVVTPNCLGCLCEASTQCNVTVGCHTPYAGAYFCGPFLISWAYWADAGKPVIKNDDPERKGAFENCVNDLYCAATTVRNYMKEFAKEVNDCNEDGHLDCIDFAYMHRNGGYSCSDKSILQSEFYGRFQTCWEVVNNASILPATGVVPPIA